MKKNKTSTPAQRKAASMRHNERFMVSLILRYNIRQLSGYKNRFGWLLLDKGKLEAIASLEAKGEIVWFHGVSEDVTGYWISGLTQDTARS
jgi:hypothetical protein